MALLEEVLDWESISNRHRFRFQSKAPGCADMTETFQAKLTPRRCGRTTHGKDARSIRGNGRVSKSIASSRDSIIDQQLSNLGSRPMDRMLSRLPLWSTSKTLDIRRYMKDLGEVPPFPLHAETSTRGHSLVRRLHPSRKRSPS